VVGWVEVAQRSRAAGVVFGDVKGDLASRFADSDVMRGDILKAIEFDILKQSRVGTGNRFVGVDTGERKQGSQHDRKHPFTGPEVQDNVVWLEGDFGLQYLVAAREYLSD